MKVGQASRLPLRSSRPRCDLGLQIWAGETPALRGLQPRRACQNRGLGSVWPRRCCYLASRVSVPDGGIIAGQSGLMVVDGWTTEDMTVKKPVALHVYWPGMELNTTPKEEFKDKSKWKALEDQPKERREKIKALEDFFEEARDYAKAREASGRNGLPAKNVIPAWEAMLPYVRGARPVMVHADDERQIKSAVQWAATNSFKIILAGARDAWKVAGLLATNKIPVIFERIYNQDSDLASTPARDTYRY